VSQPSSIYTKVQVLHAALTVLIALLFPLTKRFMPPLIALWVLTSFFLFSRANARMGWGALLMLGAYYLCNLLWYGVSDNREAASFALEVKLSFILFPLVWMFLPAVEMRQRLNVLLALVWGCLAFVGASLIHSGIAFAETGDIGEFYYARLAWFFHPTYLATYEAFALVVLGWMFVKKMFALGNPWIHHTTAALLIIHAALLESKAGFLCVILALFLVAILQIQRKRLRAGVVYFISGVTVLFATVYVSPASENRWGEVVQATGGINDQAPGEEIQAKSSSGGRIVAWKTSLEILHEHPFGVGTGDVTDELMLRYKRDGETYAYAKGLNPHNQFLQAAVAFGWIGLLVLLLVFGAGFQVAVARGDFIFGAFLMLLLLNMLFESFFEVQSGVVFFAFFYSFFVKSNPSIRSGRY
jgi:O-antigen ligase